MLYTRFMDLERLTKLATRKEAKVPPPPKPVWPKRTGPKRIVYTPDGWTYAYFPGRAYLNLSRALPEMTMTIGPYRKFLPPTILRGSPKWCMKTKSAYSRECRNLWRIALRGRNRWYAPDPVYAVIRHLALSGLVVPTVWKSPPKYLVTRNNDGIIRAPYSGRILADYREMYARLKAQGYKNPYSAAIRNPEYDEYMKHRPKIPDKFKPFPVGYQPTASEKEERVLSFLTDYAETGHMVEAARANGSTFYQFLLWANEYPHLQEQVALADHAVRMGIRSNANFMALDGDKQMISLLMREEIDKKKLAAAGGKKLKTLEMEDEVTEAIQIAQRATQTLQEAQAWKEMDVIEG